jgi:hypothetical protein
VKTKDEEFVKSVLSAHGFLLERFVDVQIQQIVGAQIVSYFSFGIPRLNHLLIQEIARKFL